VPDFVRGLGAEAVVAGGKGRRAVDLFSELGIDVAAGVTGSVRDAVGAYLRGDVKGVVACTHDGHRGRGGGCLE
jgi:predicted Fe-Mo cluster-binding NifX family protein